MALGPSHDVILSELNLDSGGITGAYVYLYYRGIHKGMEVGM
jgi:hypothetical protein